MALSAQINLSIVAHETADADISRSIRVTPATYSVTLSDGTAANQAQVAWSGRRTLSGASETLLLSALADSRGGSPATVTMTAVKGWFVRNSGTATLSFAGGPFPAGGAAVAPGAAAAQCDPSAAGMAAAGVTVTGSAGAVYDIVLVGEGTVA